MSKASRYGTLEFGTLKGNEMDYEQKYKEALKVIESLYNVVRYQSSSDALLTFQTLEKAFPELKESEDEKWRNWLIGHLKGYINQTDNKYAEVCKKAIEWLEKQKPLNNFNEVEKEKNDFVSGQFIECRKSFNEFKEFESYWLEYVGDDTYIGRSDNVLNQKFHITPRQLFTLFTHQHCPKEEKQDEQKPAWSEEDELMIKDAIHWINEFQQSNRCKNENDMQNSVTCEDWLYSLIDRVQPQPNQDWSEDDSWMLNVCCNAIDSYKEPVDKYLVKKWLKSLKPNHWKPTKEQLDSLQYMLGKGGSYDKEAVKELYRQLQKL